ncbi:YbaK/EbsC family protein [Atopobiaceae bacterium 24-176]
MDPRPALDRLAIAYEAVEHAPFRTAEEAQAVKKRLGGTGCKTLLLADRSGATVIACVPEDAKADLKAIAAAAGTGRLHFCGPKETATVADAERGGLSPLDAAFPGAADTVVVLSGSLPAHGLLLACGSCGRTVRMDRDSLVTYLVDCGHEPVWTE